MENESEEEEEEEDGGGRRERGRGRGRKSAFATPPLPTFSTHKPIYKLVGADLETYLLEKSRVVQPCNEERNYHIFYEMLQGADHHQMRKWKLLSSPDHYSFLLSPQYQPSELDEEEDEFLFEEVLESMEAVGFEDEDEFYLSFSICRFSEDEIDVVFGCLSATLLECPHNHHWSQIPQNGSSTPQNDKELVLTPTQTS